MNRSMFMDLNLKVHKNSKAVNVIITINRPKIITYIETVIPVFLKLREWLIATGPCVLNKQHVLCPCVLRINMVTDIDQTDLHRFEPSSRTFQKDEHSHQ